MDNKELEIRLKADPIVKRLLGNGSWRPAAEAAIENLVYGEECPVTSWRKSSSWQQVQMVYKRLTRESSG